MTDFNAADWAEQDANNSSPQPNGVQGGYAPSAIAPIIRAIRGAIKRDFVQRNPIYTTTGTGAAYVLTFTQGPTAYYKGFTLRIWIHANNTGACSLNVNSLGAKSILSTHGEALTAGQLRIGRVVQVVYNGTNFELFDVTAHDPKFTGTLTANVANVVSLVANSASIATLTGNTATTNLRVTGSTWSNAGPTPGFSVEGPAPNIYYKSTTANTASAMTGVTSSVWRLLADSDSNGSYDSTVLTVPLNGTSNMTYGGNAVWTAGNMGSNSSLDADLLDGLHGSYYRDLTNSTGILPNARISGAYDGITNLGMTGALTITSAAPLIRLIDNTAGSYSARLRVDANNVYFDSSTDDINFAEVFRFELDTKNGYVAGSKIVTLANDGAGSTVDADLLDGQHGAYYLALANATGTLNNARLVGDYSVAGFTATGGIALNSGGTPQGAGVINFANNDTLSYDDTTNTWTFSADNPGTGVPNGIIAAGAFEGPTGDRAVFSARQIIAGNGMTGGGDLSANRTLTLGTPGTITGSTTNSVTTTSHTHDLTLTAANINAFLGYTAASTAVSIVAGDGMSGGGAISASRTLTLGTPSNITNSTTNSVTTTSHTHALGFIAAEVYTGSSVNATSFPLGHVILCFNPASMDRNSSFTPALYSDGRQYAVDSYSGSSTVLTGTWRTRGWRGDGYLMQRTA